MPEYVCRPNCPKLISNGNRGHWISMRNSPAQAHRTASVMAGDSRLDLRPALGWMEVTFTWSLLTSKVKRKSFNVKPLIRSRPLSSPHCLLVSLIEDLTAIVSLQDLMETLNAQPES
ncbi:hypothetical protein JTE90_013234 [Oedothorax gibbosus]|uniref:Uncharacterized protein n=1 Tax=Oedothorax gibbosus TaxID=931172 RepID=A0AAV6VEM4_9ARAC|nr:hypothetical protein JTE90_013234 [Oedothorax gibbosus]